MNIVRISKKIFTQVGHIDGWLNFDAVLSTAALINIQSNFLVNKQIRSLEIGVHHGKYFIAFNTLYQKMYPLNNIFSTAIDLFDLQEFNLDNSGKGNKEIFKRHVDKNLYSNYNLNIITGDSMKLESAIIGEAKSVNFASIDGGHHYECVINDLKLISGLMSEGGIISLDDYYHPGWVSVTLAQFDNDDSTLKPLMLAGGKLFLIKDSSKGNDIYNFYLQEICNNFNISVPHSVNNVQIGSHLVETKLQPFQNSSLVSLISYDQNPLVRILRRILRILQF